MTLPRDLVVSPEFDPKVGVVTVASNIMDEFAYGGFERVVVDPEGQGAMVLQLLKEAGVPAVAKQ